MYPQQIDNGGFVYTFDGLILDTVNGREYAKYICAEEAYGTIWLETNYPYGEGLKNSVKEI